MKKNILSLLTLCIFSFELFAQPPFGTTVVNNDLNKFLGYWQYVNGVDTITIRFKKENVALPGFGGEDYLYGFHLYKSGLTIVENSIPYFNSGPLENKYTFLGLKPEGPGNNLIEMQVIDLAKGKDNRIELVLSNNDTVMTATRVRFYGEKREGGFTLPQTFALVKIPTPPPPTAE